MAAAVMELTRAAVPWPLLAAEDQLQLSDYGAPAFAGSGLENPPGFQVADYLTFDGGLMEALPFAGAQGQKSVWAAEGGGDSSMAGQSSTNMVGDGKCKVWEKRIIKMDPEHRVAFRTKSDVDVLDDGYKWRKYGKKSVKNSPNPRNYYRCSAVGCSVKKRVERDREDPSYVMTTYDGVHNHLPPGIVYYPVPRDHMATAAAGWPGSPCSWMDTLVAASQPWETTTQPAQSSS